ncbi:MAG TPA: hypothetical protein QGG06_02800, partial [Gammaproteobacteria bacterium]|nr:hypothetical protein [Gammaproteobacteria bacterium]
MTPNSIDLGKIWRGKNGLGIALPILHMVPIAQANAPSMCMLKMVWSGEKNSKANTVLRVM